MAQELATKVSSRDLVLAENKLQSIQDECKKLVQTRDAMQAEIDRKAADYNIYISQRDLESKKMRQDISEQNEQLAKDKIEFQGILKQFQLEKSALAEQKKGMDLQTSKFEDQMNNIRQYIIAVQRASSVLGL